ncbi:MAG: hypothetical protein FJ272_23600, partial [Planctomycetes bacterium]|nr:hypothetical protein [Planctomycetota bacterium]
MKNGHAQLMCLIAALALTNLGRAEPPTVKVVKMKSPPALDGKLDDACWQDAAKAGDFRLVGTHKTPVAPTEAWLATDGQWLYVGVKCHDGTPPEKLVNAVKLRDAGVNADDSVEIFLDPGTGGGTYFHFLLNVGNVQADQVVTGEKRDREWNASWRSAVFIPPDVMSGEGWSAELALPLYVFRRREGREPWRLNLCRNKRTAPSEFTSWAPVNGGFHEPASFGVIEGLKDITPGNIFAPLVLSAAVTRYSLVGGQYGYEVFGEVMNDGGRADTVELAAEDRPATGAVARAAEKFTLGPREKRKFQLRLQIAQPGDRKASLILRNPATGQVFCEMAVPGLEGLNPVRAYLDRSYYTIEATARAWALLSMSEAELAAGGFRIAAALLDGKSRALATGESPASAQEVPTELPLGSLAPGNYGLKVELLDRGKAVVGVVALTLRKHAPAPTGSNEVKIDHENRCLLLNGKPFFPVGICAQAMD